MLNELDTALYDRLDGITVIDKDGNPQSVAIILKAPEEEFKLEEIPGISVGLVDIRYAPERQDWIRSETINLVDNTAVIKDMHKPYDIMFQIAVHSTYSEDDRSLQEQVLQKLPPRTYIDVGDESFYVFLTSPFVESDILGDRRIFRKIGTYLIAAELDPTEEREVKLVLERLATFSQL